MAGNDPHGAITIYFPDAETEARWKAQAERFGTSVSKLLRVMVEQALPVIEKLTPDDLVEELASVAEGEDEAEGQSDGGGGAAGARTGNPAPEPPGPKTKAASQGQGAARPAKAGPTVILSKRGKK
jgi:hypothetical protein